MAKPVDSQRWLGRLMLAATAGALALLGAEGTLRLLGVHYPSFHQLDPHRGSALKPGAQGWYRDEGEAFVRINSDGLRSPEIGKQKPRGTYRIAVLGDSYAEAKQVEIEQTFWSILGRELDRRGCIDSQNIEVINFGVSGYGTAQELMTLREHVWVYQPDAVILAFVSGNDVRNNSRELERDPRRPYFVLAGDRLVLDNSFRADPGYRLRQTWPARLAYGLSARVRLLQLANRAKNVLNKQREIRRKAQASVRLENEAGLDAMVYLAPTQPAWKSAWAVTEAIISQMHREVVDRGARFWLITLSNGMQVHPDQATIEAYTRTLGVSDLFEPDRKIAALGRREGIAVINLAEPLLEVATKQKEFLHGFANAELGTGHWNVYGHRVAGETSAAEICKALAPGATGPESSTVGPNHSPLGPPPLW